ncbi:MAG: energy transducer TonB, partial [Candidatus Aminicenantes bacterium]
SKIKHMKIKTVPAVMLHGEVLSDKQKEELRTELKALSVKIGKMDQELERGIKIDLKPTVKIDEKGKVTVKVKPVLVVKVTPKFPEEAKDKGIYGEVEVEGTTDKKGNVINVKVLKSAHKLLDEAVIAAVKQWKYELPEHKGKPYAITFVVTVRFSAKDKDGNSWTVSIES